ncbi:hypothetical protein B0A48_15029 [Cryoendolithus antarcticus]|uniref:Uncharacterized protein n=1 Tax=Cryoendolithus antarcticus TaxID=1507870 RepID=A0A1V8SJQ3_9PEZI|nr:hypothetical protein B0A48_15029 [Cryoendolithus antarcticus]
MSDLFSLAASPSISFIDTSPLISSPTSPQHWYNASSIPSASTMLLAYSAISLMILLSLISYGTIDWKGNPNVSHIDRRILHRSSHRWVTRRRVRPAGRRQHMVVLGDDLGNGERVWYDYGPPDLEVGRGFAGNVIDGGTRYDAWTESGMVYSAGRDRRIRRIREGDGWERVLVRGGG